MRALAEKMSAMSHCESLRWCGCWRWWWLEREMGRGEEGALSSPIRNDLSPENAENAGVARRRVLIWAISAAI